MNRKILASLGVILLMMASVVGTAAAQSGTDTTPVPTTVATSEVAGTTTYVHPIVQILSAYFGREGHPTWTNVTETPTETATETATETSTETSTETTTEEVTDTPIEEATPTEEVTETPTAGPEEYAEQIAMYHDEGMGFGVLVKLYAMSEASAQACLEQQAASMSEQPTEEATDQTGETTETSEFTCDAASVQQLVDEFKSGTGMGLLFKEYGKPALLGVGHVRKALQQEQTTTEVTSTEEATSTEEVSADNSMQVQGQKSNNGNGNSKGNANGKSNKPVKVKTPNPHRPNK